MSAPAAIFASNRSVKFKRSRATILKIIFSFYWWRKATRDTAKKRVTLPAARDTDANGVILASSPAH